VEPSAIGGVIAGMILAVWVYMAAARGLFWLMRERDDAPVVAPAAWPSVAAVVPARDEADCIGDCIGGLLRQRYAGAFSVILVDDQSRDGTRAKAEAAAAALGAGARLTVIEGAALPAGWTGKLWAQHQGVARAQADYLWLTDADIVHAPDTLAWLVSHAERRGDGLTSLMAKLRCESMAERWLIPAFVFFFAMLYPFAWVNDARRRTAAAAGGCMLARRDTLQRAGGMTAIRGALIDDCALARLMKRQGPIWLGITDRVRSIRPYPAFADVGRMVSRSAYAQLGYSPLRLVGTVAGVLLVFVLPAALALFAAGAAQILGLAAWLLMAMLVQPILRVYRMSPLYGLLLPAIAALYTAFTASSAWQHARGRGGLWKGRAQANLVGPS